MAAAADWLGVGARLAELWLVRGAACPACPRVPPCPTQVCTLTCSGPATTLTEGFESRAGASTAWPGLLLAAALGAALTAGAGRLWRSRAVPAAPEATPEPAPAPPAPASPGTVGSGPVTPSQLALGA